MKTTKRILAILLVLALGLALFAPTASSLFFIQRPILNWGYSGLSINWLELLWRIVTPPFGLFSWFF
jgi:hypothetical protein